MMLSDNKTHHLQCGFVLKSIILDMVLLTSSQLCFSHYVQPTTDQDCDKGYEEATVICCCFPVQFIPVFDKDY